MTEKELKDRLVYWFRIRLPKAVVLRHEDKNTAGVPDLSVTYKGHTVWLEVKYANPGIEGRGLQKFTCLRLSNQGDCWYVIYEKAHGYRRTLIVDPEYVAKDKIENTPDECMTPGFDHEFVIQFIRRICGDHD